MPRCSPEARQQARAAADALDLREDVLAADCLNPETEPTDLWAVELTLPLRTGGVPPEIAVELARRGLTVRLSQPRNTHWYVLATA